MQSFLDAYARAAKGCGLNAEQPAPDAMKAKANSANAKCRAKPHPAAPLPHNKPPLIIAPANLGGLEYAGSFPFIRSAIANRFDGIANHLSKVVCPAQDSARRVGVAVIDDEFNGDFLDQLRQFR
jgi:hypothetical protein